MSTLHKATHLDQVQLPFEIDDIPLTKAAQKKRGYEVYVNGEEIKEVKSALFKQDKMGVEIRYGQRKEGYDGVVIRENGGGGAVTIPYTIDEGGQVYVGLVHEYRTTLGGIVANVPRGFLDKGETHAQAARREIREETGYEALTGKIEKLASGLNPNSTYFDTSHSVKEGVQIFAIFIDPEYLELIAREDGTVSYAFPDHVQNGAEDRTAERILGSTFLPLAEALESRDMFTSAAAGQLLVSLLKKGFIDQQTPVTIDRLDD
jgi:8-oxo-dGTP pyrophosphatase MutT (NUDIX family)